MRWRRWSMVWFVIEWLLVCDVCILCLGTEWRVAKASRLQWFEQVWKRSSRSSYRRLWDQAATLRRAIGCWGWEEWESCSWQCFEDRGHCLLNFGWFYWSYLLLLPFLGVLIYRSQFQGDLAKKLDDEVRKAAALSDEHQVGLDILCICWVCVHMFVPWSCSYIEYSCVL